MLQYLSKILLISLFFGISIADEPSPCGDWKAYKHEKCFKVFDSVTIETTAEDNCKKIGNGSILAIIQTSDEQEFIEKYLKDSKIADNVWIGIKKSNKVFKGLDELDLKYTNWAKNRPLNGSTELNCVEMSVDEENYGKWMDDKCQKKNVVLCQKMQAWSLSRLQDILLEKTRELKSELDSQKAELRSLIDLQKKEIIELKSRSDAAPIGFIYVQLSGQSEPNTLWPNTQWENISAKYSGLFFRAEGGQSSAFGQIQDQQTQSLEMYSDLCNNDYNFKRWAKVNPLEQDSYVYTGSDTGKNVGLKLKHNSEEIRPRNQAVRIWQRIK